MKKIGYCKVTALKAIEEVKDGDWNDIINWLEDNGTKWEKAMQDAEDTQDEEQVNKESDIDDDEENFADSYKESKVLASEASLIDISVASFLIHSRQLSYSHT